MSRVEFAVSQLPLSPHEDPKVGFYLSPFAADTLAKIDSKEVVLPFNLLGSKVEAGKRDIEGNLEFLKKIGVVEPRLWRDDTLVHHDTVLEVIEEGQRRGFIFEDARDVFFDSSGRLEFLREDETTQEALNKRREYLYYVKNGRVYSKETGEELICERRRCLLLRYPDFPSCLIDIYPNYARAEFEQLWRQFSGREVLISRTTEREIQVKLSNGQTANIDPDLYWLPWISAVRKELHLQVGDIVVANKTLKQVVLSLMFNQLLEADQPEKILVLPKLIVKGNRGIFTAHNLYDKYGPEAVRVALCLGIGSDRKELAIGEELMYLVKLTVEQSRLGSLQNLPVIFSDFLPVKNNAGMIAMSLKKIRQGKPEEAISVLKWILVNMPHD